MGPGKAVKFNPPTEINAKYTEIIRRQFPNATDSNLITKIKICMADAAMYSLKDIMGGTQ